MNETQNENPLDAFTSNGAIPTPEQVCVEAEHATMFSRTLASVKPLVDEAQDPTVLFRGNWLAQGQVVSLVASTGVGKSSMTIQTAFHWALGKKWLADPMRPLKCAIIQAEDSERDIAEQIEGMRLGLVGGNDRDGNPVQGLGWSVAEFETALKSILCPTHFIGLQGDAFIKALAEFQAATNCDMLFINPVQAFFGGDISDQESVSHWARAGIDPILKNTDHPCAAFLVMHTTKFTSGDDKGRANVDDYGEYIGAGSHEWNDWVRAKFVFLKHGKSDKYFDFKAAKRGRRLKWTNADGEETTNKMFRQCDGYIFWREVTDPSEIANTDPGVVGDPESAAHRMSADLKANGAAKISDFEQRFRNIANRATIRVATRLIVDHPEKYKLTVRDILVGRKWTKFVGLADGIERLRKQVCPAAEQQERIDEMNVQAQPQTQPQSTSYEPSYEQPFDECPPF